MPAQRRPFFSSAEISSRDISAFTSSVGSYLPNRLSTIQLQTQPMTRAHKKVEANMKIQLQVTSTL